MVAGACLTIVAKRLIGIEAGYYGAAARPQKLIVGLNHVRYKDCPIGGNRGKEEAQARVNLPVRYGDFGERLT
jgi:hypothetical protein